jgi:hypothetical protein
MKISDLRNLLNVLKAVKPSVSISLASVKADIFESPEFTSKSPFYSSTRLGPLRALSMATQKYLIVTEQADYNSNSFRTAP